MSGHVETPVWLYDQEPETMAQMRITAQWVARRLGMRSVRIRLNHHDELLFGEEAKLWRSHGIWHVSAWIEDDGKWAMSEVSEDAFGAIELALVASVVLRLDKLAEELSLLGDDTNAN